MGLFKPNKPNTRLQEAEAARQKEIEEARYTEQLRIQQEEWDRQRQDAERRHAEQLQVQQQETERQRGLQEKAAADAEALRQQQIAEQKAANTRGRDYAGFRDTAISDAQRGIEGSYSQFNDAYFNEFANKFVTANRGDVDRQYDRSSRAMKYKLADNRNLNSSAAADAFGELSTDRDSGVAKIAAAGSERANALRSQISQQKQNALNAVYGLGNLDVPDFQNDDDATAAKSRISAAVRGLTASNQPVVYG